MFSTFNILKDKAKEKAQQIGNIAKGLAQDIIINESQTGHRENNNYFLAQKTQQQMNQNQKSPLKLNDNVSKQTGTGFPQNPVLRAENSNIDKNKIKSENSQKKEQIIDKANQNSPQIVENQDQASHNSSQQLKLEQGKISPLNIHNVSDNKTLSETKNDQKEIEAAKANKESISIQQNNLTPDEHFQESIQQENKIYNVSYNVNANEDSVIYKLIQETLERSLLEVQNEYYMEEQKLKDGLIAELQNKLNISNASSIDNQQLKLQLEKQKDLSKELQELKSRQNSNLSTQLQFFVRSVVLPQLNVFSESCDFDFDCLSLFESKQQESQNQFVVEIPAEIELGVNSEQQIKKRIEILFQNYKVLFAEITSSYVQNIQKSRQQEEHNRNQLLAQNQNLTLQTKEQSQICEKLNKQLSFLTNENQNLNKEVNDKEQKLQEYLKNIQTFQDNKRGFVEELKNNNATIQSLQKQLKQLQEHLSAEQQQNVQISDDLKQIDELNNVIKGKDVEVGRLNHVIEEQQAQIDALQNGLANLELIREQDQERNEILSIKYDKELQKLRAQLDKHESQWEESERYKMQCLESQERLANSETAYKALEERFRHSEQEKNEIKFETSALIKKFKSEALYKENLIDKRVISKFLVNYFDQNTAYQVKLQILETICSILEFTDDDRVKIGLQKIKLQNMASAVKSQQQQQNQSPQKIEDADSLKDKFMIYLMNKDADDE